MHNHSTPDRCFLLFLTTGLICGCYGIAAIIEGNPSLALLYTLLTVALPATGQWLFPPLSEAGLPTVHSNQDAVHQQQRTMWLADQQPLDICGRDQGGHYTGSEDQDDALVLAYALNKGEQQPEAIVVDVTHTHVILKTPDSPKLVSFEKHLFPTGQCHTGERISWPTLDTLLYGAVSSPLESARVQQYESWMLQQHVG